ncbi:MAG: hypothetical protein ACP5I6_05880 [Caldisphaera sp.]
MSKVSNIIIVVVSVALTLILSYFIPYVWIGIIPGVIIGFMRRRSIRLISGFLIGFLGSLIMYFVYPINYFVPLAKSVGELAGISWLILILAFPLLFGLVELSAAGIVGEIIAITRKNK